MRFILICFLVLGAAMSAHAQDRAALNNAQQIRTLRAILNSTLGDIQVRLTDINKRFDSWEACSNISKVYAPNHANADANGCLEISSGRTTCPAGFTLIGEKGSAEAFCISAKSEKSTTWTEAAGECYGKSPGMHLCSAAEWMTACFSGVKNMKGGSVEWVAGVVGNKYGAALIGGSSCGSNLTNAAHPYQAGSRCCLK